MVGTSTDEAIAAIEARLSRLVAHARTGTLVELGQAQMSRSWQARIGSSEARAPLDAAIAAFDEAYGYLDISDPMRGRVASMAGWLYGIRHGVYGGSEHDRDTGIHLLAEAVAFPNLPPVLGAGCRLILGQLYLARAAGTLEPANMSAMMLGNTTLPSAVDADRAVECLRAVLDDASVSAEISSAAQTMLQLAEALQLILGGFGHGAGVFDLSRLVQASSGLQKLQEQMSRPGGQGYGQLFPATGHGGQPVAPFLGMDILANLDAMERPVMVVRSDEPPAAAHPDTSATDAEPVAPDLEAARSALRARLAELAKVPDGEAAAAELLRPTIAALPVDVVDECVALATTAVHSGQTTDAGLAGTDRYLLAVALYLRSTVAGGGWSSGDTWTGDEADSDLRAGGEQLLAAAQLLPPEHPIAASALLGLAAFIDEQRPLAGVLARLAERFQARAEAVLAAGTVPRADLPAADALRCLCAVAATGGMPDPADVRVLERAVAALPAGYPWRTRLRSAAGVAVLSRAVAEDDPDGVRRSIGLLDGPGWLGGAGTVLGALLDDDVAALRAATARIVNGPEAGDPRLLAFAGALYLRLAAGPTGTAADLTAAIDALITATRQLADGFDPELRADVQWRLAEAYRRRNGAGDAEAAQECAEQALRGVEGIRALEAAAGADSRTLPFLVADAVSALGGPCPAPGNVSPTVAELAAALRAVGAHALLYFHPVEGAGERASAVLLDPGSERVEVGGTVTGGVDDPSWSAFADWLTTRRGSGAVPRRVLVVAPGTARLVLAALPNRAGGYLTDAVVLSHVRSGAAVVELSQRVPRPAAQDPVFVVNPRGDREAATFDALVLRRMVYPRSVGLGRVVEDAHGSGTPAEVLAHCGASVLHLACGIRTTGRVALELVDGAAPATLDLAAIAARLRDASGSTTGGLVILPPDAGYDRAPALPDCLLSGGFSGVVGWLWPVPDPVAALMLFVLHTYLVNDDAAPADAVRAVHQWMRAPARAADLPPVYAAALADVDTADPRYWAALCHWGR